MNTVKERIAKKLLRDGHVNNFECIEYRVTTRLGAVIHQLRADGWEFDDAKSGYIGSTKNWQYVLKSAPKPQTKKLL